MFKIFNLCCLCLLAYLVQAEEPVSDPTKPLGFSGGGANAVGKTQDTIQLTSILIASDRKIAILNGHALQENQTLKDAGVLVKRIDADSVTLQQNGKVWRVPLNNTAVRK